MKKILSTLIVIAILGVTSQSAFAQEQFQKGDKLLNVGIGLAVATVLRRWIWSWRIFEVGSA